VSPQAVKLLMQLGYDIKGVDEAGLKGCEDDEVVNLAARENRIIITHDLGFGSIYYFSKKGQVGIIILRIHPPTVEEVNNVLKNFLKRVNLEKEKLTKCLIMLNRRKYRVLR
jgi:predicted nuclease of predicted toxin-antitoxin system